ncbi:MAG: filamentous hemagglutinin N-terminal domain-containing protein, partial [Leptolyngbya sp. SIO1D8]|nr:filamentous hemagglutinin N-terminal domain-containing protein [Leptolyngbya sp. SIO1D8]
MRFHPGNIYLFSRNSYSFVWHLIFFGGTLTELVSGNFFSIQPALAQLIPDDTLGVESTVVTSSIETDNVLVEQIEGGATRGSFLFHSFFDFNIAENQQVYFANPNGIDHILTRITGLSSSNIFGTLGVSGEADLFLLNPNGVIFGPNVQLDIRGSFLVSTADSFNLGNAAEFSATDPQAPPLLIVDVPVGLQYGALTQGDITNAGILQVGQNLVISADNIVSTGQLLAPHGELKVEGITGDVQVQAIAADTATLFTAENLILEESQLWTQGDLSLL